MLDTEAVAQSALSRWQIVGESASISSWDRIGDAIGSHFCTGGVISEAVVVSSTNVIECVVSEFPDWELVRHDVMGVIELGWSVTVLIPLGSMGSAHETLRGSAAFLQGWWVRKDNELGFTRQEIA